MSELKTQLQTILNEKTNKILPENIKKGVQIFDVTGTLETSTGGKGDIKLFKTVEEMQADTTAKEGDLAVVYRSEIQNMTVDSEVTQLTFPETVTLPTAMSDKDSSVYTRLRAVDSSVMFDGMIMLDSGMFEFDSWSDSGMIRVEYTSTDGKTYTRTRMEGDSGDLENPVELPTACRVEMAEEWNDNLGYFMQTGGMNFGGMYEYALNVTEPWICNFINTFDYVDGKVSNIDMKQVDVSKLMSIVNRTTDYIPRITILINKQNENDVYIISNDGMFVSYLYDTVNNKYIGSECLANPKSIYHINLEDESLTEVNKSDCNWFKSIENTTTYYTDATDYYTFVIYQYNKKFNDGGSPDCFYSKTVNGTTIGSATSTEKGMYTKRLIHNTYITAENQFNLTSSNQLLPGKIAYGKNGVVEGNESIYDNLNTNSLLKTVMNIDTTDVNAYGYIGDTFEKTVYLKQSSKGKYLLNYAEQNDKSWRYVSNDGTIVCEWLSSSDFIVTKNNEIIFQLSDNTGKSYNWASNSTNEVFYADDDRVCIFNKSDNIKSSIGTGLNVFKIDMHTGDITLVVTDDFITVPTNNYTNLESGSSTYGLAFITAGIIKTDSPYNNYSGVKLYDAVYDRVSVIEDTFSTSNGSNINYVCPLLASTDNPKYLLVCTRCYTTNNNRNTKLYRYNRETGEKQLINMYDSNIALGTSNGYRLGYVYETTNYIYSSDRNEYMYRFKKSGTYKMEQYKTDAAAITYKSISRLLDSRIYTYEEGDVYKFTPDGDEPIFTAVDKLVLSKNKASMNGKSCSYLKLTSINDDIVHTIDTMYCKNSAMTLNRYDIADKYTADMIAVNSSHTEDCHTTFIPIPPSIMSQSEYNTAIDTTNQILGEEVTE